MVSTKLLIAFLETIKDNEDGYQLDPGCFPLLMAALEVARRSVGTPEVYKYKGYPYNRLKQAFDKLAELMPKEPTEEMKE